MSLGAPHINDWQLMSLGAVLRIKPKRESRHLTQSVAS